MQTQVELIEQIALLRQENAFLKEELAQLKRMIFGSKKERFIPVDSAQGLLFDANQEEVEPEIEEIAYSREKPSKKNKAKRLLLPAHLPRKEEIIEPENLTENSARIGEKITEVLEYTPGKFFVTKTVRPVYKQKTGEMRVAELPTQVIPNGNAGASILAYLMVSKFIDHLPYYRQVQIFKRDGMKIPESTISGWFKKTCQLLEPLYELMSSHISTSDYIQADESPIPVLSSQKPGSTHKGYQWVFLLPKAEMVIFQYHQSRGKSVPKDVLKGFKGCLQTDGYAGYHELGQSKDITHIGCMAHARRKFDVAKENDLALASHALKLIQQVYAIEREIEEEELSAEEALQIRENQAVPVLDKLKKWMEEQYPNVLPKSAIGKAISYTLKQWPLLIGYIQNGQWKIDNNGVENKIRPLALGRKNYLFAGSHEAAQQASMMYSFFGTCKLNDIEPLQWLTETLRKIPDHKVNRLNELLPLKKQGEIS
ncbi:MAG TPA: IS66 family transposase [Flavobacteriales bacterium]|nr:IS66 family transposase [Flavobacteriales bacterium]